jgi:hypothetical protein
MKMKDLPEWPPSHFAKARGLGGTLPTHADQVTIGDVVNELDRCIRFSCGYENEIVMCSFFVPDSETAKKVVTVLQKHKGEILLSISEVEIPTK